MGHFYLGHPVEETHPVTNICNLALHFYQVCNVSAIFGDEEQPYITQSTLFVYTQRLHTATATLLYKIQQVHLRRLKFAILSKTTKQTRKMRETNWG